MIRRLLSPALAGLAIAAASPAFASTEVSLRDAPQAAGRITLGDLFEGAGQAADVVIGGAGPAGNEAVLDAGAVQMAAKRAGLDWANAEGRRRIMVASVGAAAPPSQAAPASRPRAAAAGGGASGRRAQALAYARNLNAGELLTASDLVWSDEAVAPGDAPPDAEAAIGKAARRPLRAGAAAAMHDLSAPKVIARDQMVDVAFEDDGVTLVLQAKAMGDAAVGDTVVLQNLASKKTLEAVASAPGRAVVGPEAEALRAQALGPLAFASR